MTDEIELCKRRARQEMERFLLVLGFVPADKLAWSPAPTAKSALQIAAHCAGYSRGFAAIIRDGKFPEAVQDFLGPIEADIRSVETVEQAEAMLRQGIDETIAALDTVRPEQIESVIEVPVIGPTSFRFFMTVPANHLVNHIGQLDYLQTCWDDQVVHF